MAEPLVIILVEDNDDHAELVMRTLSDHHLANNILRFSDGQTTLDYLFHQGEFAKSNRRAHPDLILLDLRLPRVDGLEVLKAIKTEDDLRHIPVVILTTSEAERDIASAYQYHANSYLVKPVSFEDFLKLLSDMGYYWLHWNMSPQH